MNKPSKHEIILITGGCRSGKSSYAEELAHEISDTGKLYIATCVPHDNEMEKRIRRHKKSRDVTWETSEVPVDVAREVDRMNTRYQVILIDCLTLWMSNLMMKKNEEEILTCTRDLIRSFKKSDCPVILVTNEVGAGIVPENKLARQFRDIAGRVNQEVAKASDRVVWVVSGIPVTIKQEHVS